MAENVECRNIRQFFSCYLLVSRSEHRSFKGRTYIGFTVDPVRRLKQHNSGMKSGGARKTNNRGPWDMVLFVYGFPNEISALRFEWSWQHPQESRRLQAVGFKKSYREKPCHFRLRVLSYMLNTGPWNRLALTVSWLREDYRLEFPIDFHQPAHIPVTVGISNPTISNHVELSQVSADMTTKQVQCSLCSMVICSKEEQIECPNANCLFSFHLECLAKHFLRSDKLHVIPKSGECPKCDKILLWGNLVRSSCIRSKEKLSSSNDCN